ncbi:MAG: PilZ domain-containing protein [Candidatus Latescibacterota bacterium]
MESLQPILPFLRPRSAELTTTMIAASVVFALGLLVLAGLYWLRRRRQARQAADAFRERAALRGLDGREAGFLLDVARRGRVRNPELLLTSVYLFDRHLGPRASQLAARDPRNPDLRGIARIRAVLGFDEVPADQALRSTRELAVGQTLVTDGEADPETGTPLVVVERDEASITVAPLLHGDPGAVLGLEPGSQIALRFWREGDTEYHFETRVADLDREAGTVILEHVDRLTRLQQRDAYRLPLRFPILLQEWVATTDPGPEPQEDEVLDASAPGPAATQEPATLAGEVVNVSAGGLCLQTREPVPPSGRLLVDPHFEGPVPLAGIACDVVHVAQADGETTVQLRFADLPAARESDIARRLFQIQVERLQREGWGAPSHASALPAVPDPPGSSS